MAMPDLNDLYYYVQVVDHGGFAAAGRALGMPKSKLSRRIALLEERLGVRLLQRTTRRFSVTDVGQTYYDHCKAMLIEAEAAQEAIDVTRAEPRGIVRMACPVALLHAHIGSMVASFMVQHPHVTVYLEATNRRVDLVGEAIDVAVRVRRPPLEDSDLALRVLAERSQCLLASPLLFGDSAIPQVPADLTAWPSLALGLTPQQHVWTLSHENGAQVELHHQPRFVSDDMLALRSAAVAGVGIVQLPTMLVREQIGQGLLMPLAAGWRPQRELIHLVFPSRRCLLPSVRALIDYLAEQFAALDEE